MDMAEQLTVTLLVLVLFFIHLSDYNSIKIKVKVLQSIGGKFIGGQGFLKLPENLSGFERVFRRWTSLIAQLVNNLPALHETPGLGRSARVGIGYPLQYSLASLMAYLVKNLPAMQEIWVLSLDWEDSLEKGKALHFHILA